MGTGASCSQQFRYDLLYGSFVGDRNPTIAEVAIDQATKQKILLHLIIAREVINECRLVSRREG
ncbi:hypothetical protein SZ29_20275 [Burkholderia pseudomallei]|nr:hypothetical protein SZ29_20275 [Burkholderia pseudomallei]